MNKAFTTHLQTTSGISRWSSTNGHVVSKTIRSSRPKAHTPWAGVDTQGCTNPCTGCVGIWRATLLYVAAVYWSDSPGEQHILCNLLQPNGHDCLFYINVNSLSYQLSRSSASMRQPVSHSSGSTAHKACQFVSAQSAHSPHTPAQRSQSASKLVNQTASTIQWIHRSSSQVSPYASLVEHCRPVTWLLMLGLLHCYYTLYRRLWCTIGR